MVRYSAGIVTAYGAAKRAGYTGTYEDFCRQQAEYAESAAAVEQAKTTAVNAAATATTKAGEATTAATEAQTAKAQTEQAASQAQTDISTAKATALSGIDTAKSTAVSAVQSEGQTQTANARAQAQAASQSAAAAQSSATTAGASKALAEAAATNAATSATNAATSATNAAQSASDAQAVLESIPEDYSDLSEDVDKLKADLGELGLQHINMYTGVDNSAERYINGSTGALVYGANYQTSDYIDVSKLRGQYLDISYTFSGAFYKADKSYLATLGRSDQIDKQVLVPDDAYYVRASCTNENEPLMQIGVGVTRANYIPYKYYMLTNLVTGTVDKLDTEIVNLFNKVNVQANTSITSSGNTSTTTGFNASDFIDVGNNEYVTIYGVFNAAIYHNDKTFSRMAVRRYSDYPYTVKLTENEKYVRITVRNAALDIARVERNIGLSDYVSYGEAVKTNNIDSNAFKMTKIYVGENCGFTTINAALEAITDNTPKNRYTIFVTEGVYNETITTKDYVDIEGESRYKSIINYISNDESDYVNRSAIFASTYTKIKNITVRTTGSKYPLHCDARYNEPYKVECYNCIFQHDGFTGETQPAGTAVGIGLYWGQHVTLEMCDCIGSGATGVAAIYCHNSSENDAAHSRFRSLTIKNCRLSNATYGLRLQAIENNQMQENECIYVGNKNSGDTPVSLEARAYQSWHIYALNNTPEYE